MSDNIDAQGPGQDGDDQGKKLENTDLENTDFENDDQQQRLIDALLRSMNDESEQLAQSLVSGGMSRLDEEAAGLKPDVSVTPQRRSVSRWLAVGTAIAALIVIGVTVQFNNPSRSAMATIARSIDQAVLDVGRHYEINVSLRTAGGRTGQRSADLYVKGGQRFAINTGLGPAGRPLWLIGNQQSAWVVPPIGPVMEGETSSLVLWAAEKENISAPYLHVTSLLERMRERYELDVLPGETLDTEHGPVECYVVAGRLTGESSQRIPDRIELWSAQDTGVALRVVATWDLVDGEAGRESLTITLKDEVQLSNDFFTPEEHGGANRRRISLNSEGSQ
ncbi:MAG: hypothetical protein AAF456_22790 [Planctomycetota bacterium]